MSTFINPLYEYDAPKFYDFLAPADDQADTWFGTTTKLYFTFLLPNLRLFVTYCAYAVWAQVITP